MNKMIAADLNKKSRQFPVMVGGCYTIKRCTDPIFVYDMSGYTKSKKYVIHIEHTF